MECDPDERLPTRPPRAAGGSPRAAGPRRGAAAGGGPQGRPAAGAGRAGHRQDHDDRRGGGRAHRAPRRRPEPHSGADLQPQGSGRVARPHHRQAGPHHLGAAGAHLPQLRLRPRPPGVRAGGRSAAEAAVRPRAAARDPQAASRRDRRRRRGLARPAPARARHQRLRRGAARRPDARGRAGPRRQGAAPARQAVQARRLGGGGGVPRPLLRAIRPRPGARLRLRGDRQDRRRAARRLGHQAARARCVRRGVRRRVPGLRSGPGGAAAGPGGGWQGPGGGGRPRPVDLRLPRRRCARGDQLPRPVPGPGRAAGPGRRPPHLPPQRPAAARGLAADRPAAAGRPGGRR